MKPNQEKIDLKKYDPVTKQPSRHQEKKDDGKKDKKNDGRKK
jgi:hypothetical protein